MRLIDADELKELYLDAPELSVPCGVILANIDDMPTANPFKLYRVGIKPEDLHQAAQEENQISKAVEEAQAVLDNIYRAAEKEVEDIIIKLKERGKTMTNFEKYRYELVTLAEKGKSFAIYKNGIIAPCSFPKCDECKFEPINCPKERIEWLYKEAKPTLTPEERGFCKAVVRGYIARDKSDRICFYAKAPNKEKDIWYTNIGEIIEIDNTYFPFITWKDSEPWSIGKLLGLEVK